jgi:sugar (pentulose or hexulose) kinase
MTNAPETIAVLDVGKTNLKILMATAEGEPLESRSCANDWKVAIAYQAADIAAMEEWFIAQLADLGSRHRIGAIIATGHGSGAVLIDESGPTLPMMDYESRAPGWLDEVYARETPPYDEVFCDAGSGAMPLAKQLIWQSHAYPDEFMRARFYLTTPQYIAWRLGGRPTTEVSSIAAQAHLWAPTCARFSAIVDRRQWTRLFPPFARAGEVLGNLSAAISKKTGLSRATKILCGVHDSNANLFRYNAAGRADDTILSTGTWMIGFNRNMPLARMDKRLAMVANVTVDGEAVASTLTMTGREFAILAQNADATDATVFAAMLTLLSQGTAALPSFVAHDGLVPGSALRGRVTGPAPGNPAERLALATLYAAFTAHACLDALESRNDIVVDGAFSANIPFSRVLASLRVKQSVSMSRSRDGTALGAALLWKRFERTKAVTSVALDPVVAMNLPQVSEAARRWFSPRSSS